MSRKHFTLAFLQIGLILFVTSFKPVPSDELQLTVCKAGGYLDSFRHTKYLTIKATIKNISDHKISYLNVDPSCYGVFTTDNDHVNLKKPLGCRPQTTYHFYTLRSGEQKDFLLDVECPKENKQSLKFRLGFAWCLPNGKTGYDLMKSLPDIQPYKYFWSDTVTLNISE